MSFINPDEEWLLSDVKEEKYLEDRLDQNGDAH